MNLDLEHQANGHYVHAGGVWAFSVHLGKSSSAAGVQGYRSRSSSKKH